jgi:hypothetical protein
VFHAPLEPHADPLVTPLHITSPWYFLWLQGMLKLGDKVLWGVILPTALIGLLVSLPYVEVGPSRRYGDRRIGLSAGISFVILLAILSFMGTPHYAVPTSPDQEAVAALLPQTQPGPLRLAPWGQLVLGSYQAADWRQAPTPAMRELLHTFGEELTRVQTADRQAVEGIMVVEDWQTDLKKVTLRVVWTDVATNQPHEFSQTAFLHRNSDYGQGE